MKPIVFLLIMNMNFCYAQTFTGDYAPAKWTLTNTPSGQMYPNPSSSFYGPSTNATGLAFTARPNSTAATPVTGKATQCIPIPQTGTLTFDFSLSSGTTQTGITYGYSINGTETPLTSGSIGPVAVVAGQVFCFFMNVNNVIIPDAASTNSGAFTNFTFAPGVLPIQLVDFSGISFGQLDELKWQTAYEQNISNFILERSVDGMVYTAVTSIPATNKINGSKYTYSSTPVATTSNYRIKIVETNGGFNYSPIILITSNGIVQSKLIEFGPNPFRDAINIVFTTKKTQRISLNLYDLVGRQIAVQTEVLQAGIQNKTLQNLGNLTPAEYLLIIVGDDGIVIANQKIIKK